MDKQIVQIRLGLFFKSDFTGDFDKFSLELKSKIGDCKETQHMPVPQSAPSQIPRFNLIFDGFNIQVAKSRIDIFSANFDKINENISKIWEVLSSLNIEIGRVGFVKNLFIEGNVDYLKDLLNNKFTDEDFKEINLRVNKRKEVGGVNCNNIEHIYNGFITENTSSKRSGIVLDKDINTLAEDISVNNFNQEQIKKIISEFSKESENFIIFV